MGRSQTSSELLGFVERAEARLLSWGFYDISFSPSELEDLVRKEGNAPLLAALEQEAGEDLADLLSEMSFDQLLFETSARPRRYRSRFAESVRLFARLRQFFSAEDWSAGAQLVGDLRVHIAPRRYPRRDQTPAECWADMEPSADDSALASSIFQELTEELHLAGFQRRALARIFREYGTRRRSGTVISAGTGSGKTKGFYIPALLRVAEDVRRDPVAFVKVIAIYPRNVLLADQFREAVAEVGKVNAILKSSATRPLTLGALLGSTPSEHWFQPEGRRLRFENWKWCTWRRKQDGSVIPHLASDTPTSPDLVWLDEDRKTGSTRLVDESGTERVPDRVLRITREQLQQNPPDILFLSLEMLNKEIGNSEWWRGLGIDQPPHRRPRLLLLDEVHAYEGVPGAMASWVLRRWQYRSRPRGLHVVGLSATLKDACHHLATMSGVRESSIDEVRPREDELEAEGAEYSLALKGDPASGASLLSTTIQAGMLLSRILTPLDFAAKDSQAARLFGRKVFAFTDNLDVLNRWLQNMSDAETGKRLAALRRSELDEPGSLRDREGQLWRLPEAIGHDLNQALRVSRCSSQDQGVDTNSNLIVATSSLEVGFDDPEVGATLHHKKPMSMSSFIQRKGRSGRRRGMRPWTVLVLSDFATDRWAFQNIERFFEPEIDSLRVPLENPYVLKAQGAMFLLDWLGARLSAGNPYVFLAEPKAPHRARQSEAARILSEILAQGSAWETFRGDFEDFLAESSVGLASGDPGLVADAILWEDPRPVLRRAIPTLLQTLESWTSGPSRAPYEQQHVGRRPLPTYIPGATFAELAAGDVTLEFPGAAKEDEVIPYLKGLREFCPGNVSKRYAVGRFERGYWLHCSPALLAGQEALSVEELFPDRVHLGHHHGVSCFRPVRLQLGECPKSISDRSTGFWEWTSTLQPEGTPWPLPVFEHDRWSTAVRDVRAFMSREGGTVAVHRAASSFRYEVGPAGQEREVRRTVLRCAETGEPQGVAERRSSDGLHARTHGVRIDLAYLQEQGLLPALRTQYFRDVARTEMVARNLNPFLAERVVETSLAMLVSTATVQRCGLQEAQRRLSGQRPAAARKVLNTIFRAGSDDTGDAADTKLAERVSRAWSDPSLSKKIEDLERFLWIDLDNAFLEWLQRRATETVAQALRTAVLALAPECAEDDFDLDVIWTAEGADIFITETSAGGVGHIERVVGSISSDPDRFEQAFSRALDVCPVDRVSRTLRTVSTAAARGSTEWLSVLAQVRSATAFTDADQARRDLRTLLMGSQLDATRSAVATVMNRLARPGTSSVSDRAMHMVNEYWARLEARTGIAIDSQVVTYVLLHRDPSRRRLEQALRELAGGASPEALQVRSFLDQLLVPSCRDACRDCLDHPSRYDPRVRPSRTLAAAAGLVPPQVSIGDVADPSWRANLRQALSDNGAACLRLATDQGDQKNLLTELFGVLGETIDAGTIFLPVAITALEPERGGWTMRVSARSAAR